MAEQRLTRKDIREPDQFISTSIRFSHWLREHARYLIYGTLGITLLIGIFILWSTWQTQREQMARILFYEATKLLDTTGRHNAEITDQSRVKEQLNKLVRDYKSTSVSALSHWYLGQLAFESGDYIAALAAYQYTQQRLSQVANTPMAGAVALAIGYVQEVSEKCDQAVTNFDAVLRSSAHWLRGEAYLGLGRCYREAGDRDKMMTLSDRVLADRNLSELSRQNTSEKLTFLTRQSSEHTK